MLFKNYKRRLQVGDLVRVKDVWSNRISDWIPSDSVAIVVEVNSSDDNHVTFYGPENTLVTVLVNGEVLEEEYYERDLSLIE